MSTAGHYNILRLDRRIATMRAVSTQDPTPPTLYHGVFRLEPLSNGEHQVARHPGGPMMMPDPDGRLLRIATLDSRAAAICPSCERPGQGGFVSFVQDLRLVYACPSCRQFVWLPGA
jgi:hypothetical protein